MRAQSTGVARDAPAGLPERRQSELDTLGRIGQPFGRSVGSGKLSFPREARAMRDRGTMLQEVIDPIKFRDREVEAEEQGRSRGNPRPSQRGEASKCPGDFGESAPGRRRGEPGRFGERTFEPERPMVLRPEIPLERRPSQTGLSGRSSIAWIVSFRMPLGPPSRSQGDFSQPNLDRHDDATKQILADFDGSGWP